jgi:D-glycero-D-manno-heptose 1,7-bisphosphate phosphatase
MWDGNKDKGIMHQRGLLLDRDGVINIDHGYIGKHEQFEFMSGLFPFLRDVQDLGWRLAILTNQSGVARGRYTIADYEKLTAWMLKELAKEGITIDLVLACFEHPEGTVKEFARESFWRKPNPGMVLEAINRLHLDPARSAFLGDQPRDLEAAAAGGIGKRLLLSKDGKDAPQDALVVKGFGAALKALAA